MPDFLFCYGDIPSKTISFAWVDEAFMRAYLQWPVCTLLIWNHNRRYCIPVLTEFASASQALKGPRLQRHDWSKHTWSTEGLKASYRLELVCYQIWACLMCETTYRWTHPHSNELTHMQQERHAGYRHRHRGSRSLRLPLRGKTKTGDERGK